MYIMNTLNMNRIVKTRKVNVEMKPLPVIDGGMGHEQKKAGTC